MNLLQAGDLPHFSTFYQYFLNARDWLEVRSSSSYLSEGQPLMICSFSLYAYSGFLSICTCNKTDCDGQESNLRFCPCSTGVLLITLFTTKLEPAPGFTGGSSGIDLVYQVGFEPTHPVGTDLQSAAALQLDR